MLLLCERELQILPVTVTKLTDVPSETTCGESATVTCGETSITVITAYHGKNCLFLFIYVLVLHVHVNFFLYVAGYHRHVFLLVDFSSST